MKETIETVKKKNALLRELLLAGVFLALAIVLCIHAWASPTTRWIGGCCDPEQNIWFLRWTPFAIAHGLDPFVTDYLNYPSGVNLMWNASMPLAGLILAPVTETAGPIFAYNLLITSAIALSAWCAYLALRRYTVTVTAAGVGAAVYGFSPYMVSHATQNANLTMAFTPPLVLMLFDEAIIRRRYAPLKVGILLGFVAAAQLLLAEEILASEALAALVLASVLAAMYPASARQALPYVTEVAFSAVPVFVALGAWPLLIQFFGPQRVIGPLWPSGRFSTDMVNLVIPTTAQRFAAAGADMLAVTPTAIFSETTAFIGLPLMILAGFTVGRCWSRAAVRVAATTGATLTLLSLGPHLKFGGSASGIPLPWILVDHVPLLNDLLPERLTLYMYLCLGFLIATFIDAVVRRGRLRHAMAATAVLIIALLPLVPRQLPAWRPLIPPFFAEWGSHRIPEGSVVLLAPRPRGGAGADGMLWQGMTGDAFRMPDGFYFVPKPGGGAYLHAPPSLLLDVMYAVQLEGRVPRLTQAVRLQMFRDLRDAGVATIIVGPMAHRPLMIELFRQLFGRPPLQEGGVAYWRGSSSLAGMNGVHVNSSGTWAAFYHWTHDGVDSGPTP